MNAVISLSTWDYDESDITSISFTFPDGINTKETNDYRAILEG